MTFPLRRTVAVAAVVILAGCSGDDGGDGDIDPAAALDRAADLLDDADSVRFTLEGADLPESGTVVIGADGVAAPPASFEGEIRIKAGALPASIAVVSIDGTLWAQLPLTDGFDEVDPASLGFGDPGNLIDPEAGVSRLLRSGTDLSAADQVRVDGEVFDQVESTLPGELVGQVLAIADPGAEVNAVWALDAESGHLRQATLTGPFYEGGDQTYTVALDGYDEPVDIRAPTD